jgi:hypothetical protein
VIVGAPRESKPTERLYRVVDLDSGRVAKATDAVVVAAIRDSNLGALQQALDLVAETKLAEAKPDLARIMDDQSLDIEVRLRAAVALATLGDDRGAELVCEAAIRENRQYAVRSLPAVLGEKSAPVLREIVLRFGEEGRLSAGQPMSGLGEKAMPTLIEMLEDRSHPVGQRFAATCVCTIGAPARQAVPALTKILHGHTDTKDLWSMRNTVSSALGSIGPDARSALPLLVKFKDEARAELERVREKYPESKDQIFNSPVWDAEYRYKQAIEAIK